MIFQTIQNLTYYRCTFKDRFGLQKAANLGGGSSAARTDLAEVAAWKYAHLESCHLGK